MDNKNKNKDKFLAIEKTAINNNQFSLVDSDVYIREGNFFASANNALYGSFAKQNGVLSIGTVVYFQDFNLKDIYFINAAAGSNTVINFQGVIMSEGRKKEMGVA